jgi:hypothetical protein
MHSRAGTPSGGRNQPVPNTPTIIEEAASAMRGVAALVIGDRRAPQYFDFSQRGLVGSFIAFLSVTLLNAGLPLVLGRGGPPGETFRAVAVVAVLFACQIGFCAIVLRQLKRLDGLVPYIIADNWATFTITLGLTILTLFGFSGEIAILLVGILVIVIEINIARLIVTLSPMQIAMFIVAQFVGVALGLLLTGGLFPTPEAVGAASSLPA